MRLRSHHTRARTQTHQIETVPLAVAAAGASAASAADAAGAVAGTAAAAAPAAIVARVQDVLGAAPVMPRVTAPDTDLVSAIARIAAVAHVCCWRGVSGGGVRWGFFFFVFVFLGAWVFSARNQQPTHTPTHAPIVWAGDTGGPACGDGDGARDA